MLALSRSLENTPALLEMPIPTPGPDEVLVRVRRVGLSGADFARLQGHRPTPSPIVPGHEFSGEIAGYGRQVHGWDEGDRVAVSRLVYCGRCLYCSIGRETLCETGQQLGFDRDGALAEYVIAPARNAYHLPDHADWSLAAAVDPLASTLPAIARASIMFEDVVVIIGAGALGLYALQLARLAGPQRIIVLGRRPDRLAVAREWADDVIDVTETRGNEAVMRLTGGQGANVVIEATGDPSGAADALAIAGRAARVALLGIFDQPAPMLMDVVGRHEISLYGTRGYSHKEFMQALSMLMGGHVRHTPIITHTLPLTEFEQGLALIAQREAIRVHLSA